MTSTSRAPLAQRFRGAGAAAGSVIIVLGASVLIGWQVDSAILKSVVPGAVTMKPNTALLLMLAGVALRLQSTPAPSPNTKFLVLASGVVVLLGAALTLVEYLAGLDLGIDQILFDEAPADIGSGHPGRMAPNTALCFLLIGARLAFPDPGQSRLRLLQQWLAVAVFAFAFTAITGYFYGVRTFYGVAGFTPMAIHTAIGFAILSAGALMVRPESGVISILAQDTQSGATIRRLLPMIVVTPFAIGWLRLQGQRANFYGLETGLSIMVLAYTWILAGVALLQARAQGAAETARQESLRDDRFLLMLGESLRALDDPAAILREVSTRLGEHLGVSTLSVRIEQPVQGAPLETGTRKTRANDQGEQLAIPLLRDGRLAAQLVIEADDAVKWTSSRVSLVEAVADKTWQWLERQRAEHKLKLSEERLRLLVEGARDYAIIMLGQAGEVVSWNEGAERLTGYHYDEIEGRHFSVFFSEEDQARDLPAEELRLALQNGRYEEEAWRIRKDGSRYWANMIITSVKDQNGTPRGFAQVTKDFSERQLAQEQLLAREKSLAATVKEREVLLQEVQHRVKNNLQIITSLINMQMRQVTDGTARSALMEFLTRIGAIAHIHEQLYQAHDYAQVQFSEYVQSLARDILRATGSSQADVSLNLNIEPVALAVDKAIPCGLILNELITNSIKHAFPGGRSGSIQVELRKQPAGILLSVADDGVVLADDFEIEKATSLGLRLVCMLVDQLDGRLDIVRSGGTMFRLTFPLEGQPP